MKFNGDIIITDPCYIVKNNDDWYSCNFGDNLEELNINTFITSSGGDCVGNCVTNAVTKEVLGKFGSDSSMVSVMSLSELLEYNPDCLKDLSKHCYTIIKDFVGEVKKIDIEDDENQYWAFIGEGNIMFRTDYVEL